MTMMAQELAADFDNDPELHLWDDTTFEELASKENMRIDGALTRLFRAKAAGKDTEVPSHRVPHAS